jgi:UDP-galactopyranose mutase
MMTQAKKTILVVGAGFAGATYAREIAEHGFEVHIIDKRPHIAGNAYDKVNETGVRIHKYGPHLFHTNNEDVLSWVMRFGVFVPYEHKVQALLSDGRCVPLPINRRTVNSVFGTNLKDEADVRNFLAKQATTNSDPKNAAQYLYATIGKTLTELFFRSYTKKMWARDLEDMDTAVVKRLPVRYDDEDRYFPNDRFQMLPRDGYTRLFETILDRPNIKIMLGQAFDRSHLRGYLHCFNSMPIDEFFDNALGPLPYRSIRFHHIEKQARECKGDASVINFTDNSCWTRETYWYRLPGHQIEGHSSTTITREEPCDYLDNNLERYYPVKTSDGRYDSAYQSYKKLAQDIPNVSFIGRCGTYQYLDMHQVINQSLVGAQHWIRANT